MESRGSLAFKYSEVAKDETKSTSAREAAVLLSVAETVLENGEAEALVGAQQAVDAFKAADEGCGLADALQLLVRAHHQKEDLKSAYHIAKDGLALVGEDKYGKACMLMSMAECTSNKFGAKKREEAEKNACKAADLFKEVGDKKMEARALMVLSHVYFCKGAKTVDKKEYEKAQQVALDALEVAICSKDQIVQANVLHTLAIAEIHLDDFSMGLRHEQDSADLWELLGSKHNEGFAYHCMAAWHISDKNYDAAIEASDKAQILFEESNYGRGYVYAAMGHKVRAYLHKGDQRSAMRIAQHALNQAQSFGDVAGEASALQMIYDVQSSAVEDREEALETAEKALTVVREREKDRTTDVKLWEASLLNKLAWDQMRSERWEDASRTVEAALELAREVGEPLRTAELMSTQCHVRIGKNDETAALQIANQARDIYADKGNIVGEAYACLDISHAYSAKGDDRRALGSCKTAAELFAEAECVRGLGQAEQLMAVLYHRTEDAQGFSKAAQRASEAAQMTKNVDGQASSMILRSQAALACALKEGDPDLSKDLSQAWQSALAVGRDTIAFCRSTGIARRLAEALHVMSEIYIYLEEVEDAVECIDEGMSICESNRFLKLEGQLHFLMAKLYAKMDNMMQAKSYIETAINIFAAVKDDVSKKMAEELRDKISPPPDAPKLSLELPSAQQLQVTTLDEIEKQMTVASDASEPQKVLQYIGPTPEEVAERCTACVLEQLGIDEVEEDMPLMDAGLDSLTAVELRTTLFREFKEVAFPSSLIFDFPSIKALGSHIYGELRAAHGFH